jgi:Tfp pilus assembly major pilin PilA
MRIQRKYVASEASVGAGSFPGQAGFTVVEVLIMIGIASIILGLMAFQIAIYYHMTWTGGFAVAPTTAPNGTTTTFVYKVTGYSDRTGRINGTQRPVQVVLSIQDPNEGVIQSYVDASGTVTADRHSINALTDTNGSVSITVKIDSQPGRTFLLTAIDTGPGCTGTACSEFAPVTVVP